MYRLNPEIAVNKKIKKYDNVNWALTLLKPQDRNRLWARLQNIRFIEDSLTTNKRRLYIIFNTRVIILYIYFRAKTNDLL